MHPESSESPADGAAEPSLEESAGDHGDVGPGVRKEGATASGSRGGEDPCASHMPIHAAGSNQHRSHMTIHTATRTASPSASHVHINTARNSQHPSNMPIHTAMGQPAHRIHACPFTVNEC